MLRQHVASYTELKDQINSLDPPENGKIRVFRGQSKDYPLVPSGRRRKVPRASIWAHYSRQMIMSLQQQGPYEDIVHEMQLHRVWLQALAQHYGAGSNYLDVSHDLGISTWFARHTTKVATLKSVVGPPGDSSQDSNVETTWLQFFTHTGPAYVYVLDLEPWGGQDLPKAGEIVDLHDAPELLHSSRIEVQSGCLVWADKDQDFKSHAIREFVLDGGIDDSPYVSWSIEQMFPAPAEDAWYARFLSLPFLIDPDQEADSPQLRQSLPVMLFLSSKDSHYVTDIRSKFRYMLPSLIYQTLSVEDVSSGSEYKNDLLAEATPIVLEGPQISAHPPVGDESWNHEVLLSDWTAEVEAFDIGTGKPVCRVSLFNALVEFSPLDEVGWFEGIPMNEPMLRAVWILRDDDGLRATLFLQDYPFQRFTRIGPIFLQINNTRRLGYSNSPDSKPTGDIAELHMYGKAIIACLVLLRDCSPLPKAAAYPQLVVGNGEDGWDMLVSVSSDAARLFRGSGSTRPWYTLRHQNGEPFTTVDPNLASLKLHTTFRSYAGVSNAEISQRIKEELS